MMFLRDKLAIIFSTLNAPTISHAFSHTRIVTNLREHYDRSPHCRTVSQTGFSSFIFSRLRLFCGVGAIHLDRLILPYFATHSNGGFLQFSQCFVGHFAGKQLPSPGFYRDGNVLLSDHTAAILGHFQGGAVVGRHGSFHPSISRYRCC